MLNIGLTCTCASLSHHPQLSSSVSILATFYTGLAVFYLGFDGQHIYCHPGPHQVVPLHQWESLCAYLESQYYHETLVHPDLRVKLASGVFIGRTWIWHIPSSDLGAS